MIINNKMALPIISTIGIDKEDIRGKLMTIIEEKHANSNFFLSCIMSERALKKSSICLVTFHNTFGHYHNIGIKLGYNLSNMKEKGQLVLIEPIKEIAECFSLTSQVNVPTDYLSNDKENIVESLYCRIKNNVEELSKTSDNICVIIDDISKLLDLKVPLDYIVKFIQYIKGFMTKYNVALILNTHTSNKDSLIISNMLSYMSDIRINVSGLKTGYSSEVSGRFKIFRQMRSFEDWAEQTEYQYKLFDRQIKIFAPGTAMMTS